MINQKLSPNLKGHVKVTSYHNGEEVILYDDHNAINPLAKKIIAHSIGGDAANFQLKEIRAYNAGLSLLATRPITSTYPAGDDKVLCVTRFEEASFNDTATKFELVGTSGEVFSDVSGLSIFKDNTLLIQIDWLITINDI